MLRVPTVQSRTMLHFFPNIEDTALYSALQGHLGQVLADDLANPRVVFARVGHYCFFGGDASLPAARAVVENIEPGCYMVSFEESWNALFLSVFPTGLALQHRFMLEKDMDALDEARLRAFHAHIPDGYRLVPIDLSIATLAFESDWSQEYIEQYRSPEDFVQRGFGYALVKGDEVACIATAFSFYDEGIDVGIATNPAHRQLGLATIAASRLVLFCKQTGRIANWDAANELSLRLARKLGYRLQGEYQIYKRMH